MRPDFAPGIWALFLGHPGSSSLLGCSLGWPRPKAATKGRDQKPRPGAAARGRGRRPRPRAAAESHGPRPRPRAAAEGPGPGPRPWATAQGRGAWPWRRGQPSSLRQHQALITIRLTASCSAFWPAFLARVTAAVRHPLSESTGLEAPTQRSFPGSLANRKRTSCSVHPSLDPEASALAPCHLLFRAQLSAMRIFAW